MPPGRKPKETPPYEERPCEAPLCEGRFTPVAITHRYCSQLCKGRAGYATRGKVRQVERACEGPDCDVRFVPLRSTQVYCSRPCKGRGAGRAYYATPAGRANRIGHAARGMAEKRAAVRALKQAPCMDCGLEWPPFVMDFDHVRGEKRMEVGRMLTQGYTLEAIMAEIEKCDLVCSNCHRIRTWAAPVDIGASHQWAVRAEVV